jgi:hypothetical protein
MPAHSLYLFYHNSRAKIQNKSPMLSKELDHHEEWATL